MTVDELVRMVNVALGDASVAVWAAGDADGNGAITIDEILGAVNHVLSGCGD